MATLIDRAALIAELEYRQGWQNEKEICRFKEGFDCGLEAAIEDVHNAPTVDAVPVVRCKDCRFWSEDGRCEPLQNGLTEEYTMATDFCSYGERRKENEDGNSEEVFRAVT